MKLKSLTFILLLMSTVIFIQTKSDRRYRVKVGDKVPDIVLHLTNGTTTPLE